MSEILPFQAQNSLLLQEIAVLEKNNSILQNSLLDKENTLLETQLSVILKDEKISQLEAIIAKYKRMLFGSTRERFEQDSPIQLALFSDLTQDDIAKIERIIEENKEKVRNKEAKVGKKAHRGRNPLPKHLPVVEVVINPTEDTTGMVLVGQEVSETLEYKQGGSFIKRIIRTKYAPASKEGRFIIAPMPESVFPKCIAGPSLIAKFLVDKYVLHLPIHRNIDLLKREGIVVSPSTACGWGGLGIGRIEILYKYLETIIFTKNYLQLDETTISVLDKLKKGTTHQGYLWAYNDPIERVIFFKYEHGRAAKYPEEMMKNFTGYMQTDGYAGYEQMAKWKGITHLMCWAHARRKFEEALSNDKARAELAMILIQKLYEVEREAREKQLSPEARKALRLEKSLPIYELLGKWIATQMSSTLPKSAIGKALTYTFERWDELGVYLMDGNLEIDNNLVENAIRPVALGRNNWLFCGNHEAAQRAAIMYTFMDLCKKHNVDPYKWLQFVLENILTTKPSQYADLLPQNIKNNPNF